MRTLRVIFFSLALAAVSLCALGDGVGPVNPAGHVRGKKTGGYTLKVAGTYSGVGTSAVTSGFVSITVQLKAPNGYASSATFNNMIRGSDDRFQGTASFENTTLTLSGRVDMPAATDPAQTQAQAMTGRVTATFVDTSGRGGRLVAIQDAESRGAASGNP